MTRRTIRLALTAVFLITATLGSPQTHIALHDELLALGDADQSVRESLPDVLQQHGADSQEAQTLILEMIRVDARNLQRLKEIVSEHGWPGRSMVGPEAAGAAFLIVQHADLASQLELFPLVQAAVEAGELERRSFALLQDRILVRQGEPQIFGTQLYLDEETATYHPYPIEDEVNVDARRAEIGMMPLAEYIESAQSYFLGNN